MTDRKVALVEVSRDYLADAIHLPAGTEIEAIVADQDHEGVFLLRVRNEKFKPVAIGSVMPKKTVIVTVRYGESRDAFTSKFSDE